MTNETTTQSAKGLFAGKARTVAAVAAFSGLALATTVSVQATQNASDEQAPAAAVSEAPASENTVSAEPAAKADKAEKAEKAPAKKAEPAKAPAQSAVVQAAPVAEVTPVEAPAAPQVAPAAQTVTPVAEQAPAQGRHAAQPTQQTLQAEAAAEQGNAIYNYGAPQGGYTAQTGYDTTASTGTVTTQSSATPKQAKAASSTPASGQGQAILSAAEGQIGVNQDCTALVSNALAAVGINHHGWPASYKSLGTPVSAAEAQAGDIAYYADGGAGVPHVAIYAGNGQAIHGGWNGNQTVKTTANVGSGPEYIRVG